MSLNTEAPRDNCGMLQQGKTDFSVANKIKQRGNILAQTQLTQ